MIWASQNHVVGRHETTDNCDPNMEHRVWADRSWQTGSPHSTVDEVAPVERSINPPLSYRIISLCRVEGVCAEKELYRVSW